MTKNPCSKKVKRGGDGGGGDGEPRKGVVNKSTVPAPSSGPWYASSPAAPVRGNDSPIVFGPGGRKKEFARIGGKKSNRRNKTKHCKSKRGKKQSRRIKRRNKTKHCKNKRGKKQSRRR